ARWSRRFRGGVVAGLGGQRHGPRPRRPGTPTALVGTGSWSFPGHRLRRGVADEPRLGTVLGDQTRGPRIRRMAFGDLSTPRYPGAGHLPPGSAHRHARELGVGGRGTAGTRRQDRKSVV